MVQFRQSNRAEKGQGVKKKTPTEFLLAKLQRYVSPHFHMDGDSIRARIHMGAPNWTECQNGFGRMTVELRADQNRVALAIIEHDIQLSEGGPCSHVVYDVLEIYASKKTISRQVKEYVNGRRFEFVPPEPKEKDADPQLT